MILKKQEFQEAIDSLERKIQAIDEVLGMFPEDKQATLPGTGKFVGMTVSKAIEELLKSRKGRYMAVREIAAELAKEGIESDSKHFTTIVSTNASRMVGKLLTPGERDGVRVYAYLNGTSTGGES